MSHDDQANVSHECYWGRGGVRACARLIKYFVRAQNMHARTLHFAHGLFPLVVLTVTPIYYTAILPL